MFCKLALGNVRRSFRDYGVYLLTLTFGACLFYTFNSVEDQGAILYLREKSHETVRAILTVLGVLSVFVAVVLACLIFSAFASSGAPIADTSLPVVTMSWQYVAQTIFNMLVLVGLVKGAERIAKEMFGL